MAEHTPNFSLPYPKGSDRVAVHSDIEALALKTDAQISGELQEQVTRLDQVDSSINDLTYRRTPPTGVTVDEMRHRDYTGSYRVLASTAQALGLPVADHGILTVTHMSGPTANGHVIQTWETRGGYRWDRYILAGTDRNWATWTSKQRDTENTISTLNTELAAVQGSVTSLENRVSTVEAFPVIRVDTSVGKRVFVGDVMIQGETATRNINNLITPNVGWIEHFQKITIKRENSTVAIAVTDIRNDGTGTGRVTLLTLPAGFRPNAPMYGKYTFRGLSAQVETDHRVTVQNPSPSLDYFYLMFFTEDPWPTTLPGTPA